MTEIPQPHLDADGDVLPEDYSDQVHAPVMRDEHGRSEQDIRASVAYMLLALSIIRQYKGPPEELREWWRINDETRRAATVTPEQEEELIRACVARIEWLRMHPPKTKRRFKKRVK